MKKTGRKIALFIILIAGLITLGSSMVSTYNDEYKLVLQFGKVVRVIDTPGLSFKVPFIQTTQSIHNYEMVYDLVPSEVNTRDKKVMLTDSFALWSVTVIGESAEAVADFLNSSNAHAVVSSVLCLS